ncbi:unnamed protein product [Candida verbasci]|uniref:Phosphatidylethanolamine N-methyltransferase n=1 Tax=Candida verbasci TaxID=1227364 RepID=A0A9W4TSY5_9ASCO|nr:unnamed protein product [Candida verbasci]
MTTSITTKNMESTKKNNDEVDSKIGPKGITFSGETFIVPETHDMVKTLFDPTIEKSQFEKVILICLLSNLLVFLIPSNQLRIYVFIGLYIFWRLSYNFGIGWLLQQQSQYNTLVNWSKKYNLLNGNSLLSNIIQKEIKSQRGKDYKIDSYPIEFNTWLIYRKFVDLVLMSDFVTFILVVYCCCIEDDNQFIHNQSLPLIYGRIIGGSILILFNLWVKVNAHNTIKDYAWYWGDFFFRQINNEELIFDGVFEMVPHPMYSVGYIGYYGFALIAKSYTVLSIAIFGHFLQMIFLHYIENPHIDKIYGPSKNEISLIKILKLKDLKNFDNLKPLIGLYNFNIMRGSDLINLILVGTYSLIIPFCTNSSKLIFGLTMSTKLFESFFINILLVLQSKFKFYTKWCLANDIPVEKSLNNWAIIYNSLINLTYSSLFGLNLKNLLSQEQSTVYFSNWFYLRLFLGVLLIITQIWINSSIVDSIGYFGWFYGDFFIPKSQSFIKNLTKAGVYRYLNNPEQIFGVCGVMGVFFIWPTFENLICCILWVLNNFIRINFIEKWHMIKIYGESQVNQDSGVTKTFKKHLIPDVIQRRINNDEQQQQPNKLRSPSHSISSVTDSLDSFIKELRNSKTKLSQQKLIELSQNLSFENSNYELNILGLYNQDENLPKFTFVGTPIEISWKSPIESHSKKDWIGLYKIVQTSYSRNITLLSSSGRWTYCETSIGQFKFEKDKLFWEEGLYEFRYHVHGKHDVAYISQPFEIKIKEIKVPNDINEIDSFSNLLKQIIFSKIIPINSIDESISEIISNSNSEFDLLETFNLLSSLISKSTKVNINSKIFLNNDKLTIKDVGLKLIHINQVLDELSTNNVEEKKNI